MGRPIDTPSRKPRVDVRVSMDPELRDWAKAEGLVLGRVLEEALALKKRIKENPVDVPW